MTSRGADSRTYPCYAHNTNKGCEKKNCKYKSRKSARNEKLKERIKTLEKEQRVTHLLPTQPRRLATSAASRIMYPKIAPSMGGFGWGGNKS